MSYESMPAALCCPVLAAYIDLLGFFFRSYMYAPCTPVTKLVHIYLDIAIIIVSNRDAPLYRHVFHMLIKNWNNHNMIEKPFRCRVA